MYFVRYRIGQRKQGSKECYCAIPGYYESTRFIRQDLLVASVVVARASSAICGHYHGTARERYGGLSR